MISIEFGMIPQRNINSYKKMQTNITKTATIIRENCVIIIKGDSIDLNWC